MAFERIYIEHDLPTEETLRIEGEEFHHLFRVLRIRTGETVEIINGKGVLAKGSVLAVEKTYAEVRILSRIVSLSAKPGPVLVQALPRQPRLEYILEKSTELGVSKIILFPSKKSERDPLSPSGQERAKHILISAIKQSGRLTLPELVFAPSLSKAGEATGKETGSFGDTRSNASPLMATLMKYPDMRTAAIGPEKGFHPEEVLFMEETLGWQGVKLHDNILRTDTAAIAILAILTAVRH